MVKTAIVVQARVTSTRLPGKILMDLAGHSVLFHVLQRCHAIVGADVVCCAIPRTADTGPLVAEAKRCRAVIYRGSETDVLDRYYQAARMIGADVIMRVTSDCPLIDPDICARVLQLRDKTNADYASNNLLPSWPQGLDCEAFTFSALERAATEARDAYEREHVTPWLRSHPSVRRANLLESGGDIAKHRWTLDYPEDLEFFRALFERLPRWPAIVGIRDVLEVLAKFPEISTINANRRDIQREQTKVLALNCEQYSVP